MRDSTQRISAGDAAKLMAGLGLGAFAVRRGLPALKGSIGVTAKTLNSPFFQTWLGRRLRPLTRTALYGDSVASIARRNGVAPVVRDSFHKADFEAAVRPSIPKKLRGTWVERLLEKMTLADSEKIHRGGGKVRFWGAQTVPDRGKASKGFNIGARDTKANRLIDDKVRAAREMSAAGVGGVMPDEISFMDSNLENVFKDLYRKHGNKLKTRDLISAIEGRLGHPVIVKSRSTTSSFLPKDFSRGGRRYNETVLAGENAKRTRGGSWRKLREAANRNYLMQEKLDLDEFNDIQKSSPYTRLKDFVFGKIYGKERLPQLRDRQINEMRLHVVNGKVVPYATNMKWSLGYLNPFETGYRRRAESELQKIVDKLSASKTGRKAFDFNNSVYGVDAAFDKNGKLRIIEWNPTGNVHRHNGSAQMNMWNVRDAVTSAILNRMPLAQKLQLLSSGSGIVGGSMLASSGLSGIREKAAEAGSFTPYERGFLRKCAELGVDRGLAEAFVRNGRTFGVQDGSRYGQR